MIYVVSERLSYKCISGLQVYDIILDFFIQLKLFFVRLLIWYFYYFLDLPLRVENIVFKWKLSYGGNKIPYAISNMTQLLYLVLDTNCFEGNITSSLKNCRNLQVLDLAQNKLNITIAEFSVNLSSLSIGLDMSHNSLRLCLD